MAAVHLSIPCAKPPTSQMEIAYHAILAISWVEDSVWRPTQTPTVPGTTKMEFVWPVQPNIIWWMVFVLEWALCARPTPQTQEVVSLVTQDTTWRGELAGLATTRTWTRTATYEAPQESVCSVSLVTSLLRTGIVRLLTLCAALSTGPMATVFLAIKATCWRDLTAQWNRLELLTQTVLSSILKGIVFSATPVFIFSVESARKSILSARLQTHLMALAWAATPATLSPTATASSQLAITSRPTTPTAWVFSMVSVLAVKRGTLCEKAFVSW